MKTLITGGAGFVGSHLADRLIEKGHEITVIDDLSTGRYRNVAHLEGHERFRLIIDTVLNRQLMEELIRESDRVFHMASAVGVKLIMERPVSTIETIFKGTDVVLELCSRYRKRVLIPSTSEVYGKGISVPFKEDDDLLTGATNKHRWAYACAKTLDEFLAIAHWKETRLPVVVVRLFNTVGPRQTGQYGMVVPRFVKAAMDNEPITVHGDGSQSRCFGHVADIVDGLVKALENRECFGQVINLGNSEETSIIELAQKAIEMTGSTSEIRYIPYEEAYGEGFEDMQRRVPSLEKAANLIGYKPTRTLEDIINDVSLEFSADKATSVSPN
ncbi:MAG: NAD-dependent epimerase/dehydratase family protein [Acidobacteria bacterium]|nr:MAG: NAD-dependent epimerase/dehydratase family protein [Acidobacteriota bacterium]REK02651.1 MAG: NAD-dependent epimerase/dehydratase family protein [Acidobacteriota bacterium]REK13545.1 MAG: NAD-dependent epimerase/dehydratase family protein [Acidobacteriota bacterium]REK41539.1 MAG: NAD-dependent epimerase/dehydratase family protein [Acidobacteriota bacterium]